MSSSHPIIASHRAAPPRRAAAPRRAAPRRMWSSHHRITRLHATILRHRAAWRQVNGYRGERYSVVWYQTTGDGNPKAAALREVPLLWYKKPPKTNTREGLHNCVWFLFFYSRARGKGKSTVPF
jgi:hypothetical protein